MKTLAFGSFTGALALLFSATSLSSAGVLTVINKNDSGPGSLRQAIQDASADDRIVFAAGVIGEIALTGGELLVDKPLSIIGPGAKVLTVSGDYVHSVFDLNGTPVSLSGLTITKGGKPFGPPAIYNGADLTLSNCAVSLNYGAGLWHGGTNLRLLNCSFIQNQDGGLLIYPGGNAFLTNCSVLVNYSYGFGGGINNQGTLVLRSCTIAGNGSFSSTSDGGGVYTTGTVDIGNTIVADNGQSNDASVTPDVSGDFISAGYNLIGKSDGSSSFINGVNHDLVGTSSLPLEPLFGAVQDNGGPTQTTMLLPGSPAIDQGNSFGVGTDGRGYLRPFDYAGIANADGGDGSDIGAVEAGSSPVFAGNSSAQVNVDASQTVRVADARWFGLNTAIWDSNFDTPSTAAALNELGCRTLRFPGGSLSDFYHWATGNRDDGYPYDPTKFSNFMHIATNAAAQVFITVNYGTGTANEAADWVRAANITNHCGFQYWEIGNECYGSWEADNNTNAPQSPHDPWTYATRFVDYYTQMKAADPTIKIGVVVAPGEDSYAYNFSHPAYNPRTGLTHYGWTPVLLSTLSTLGVTPDFVVHHFYPEYQMDSDPVLLQSAVNWAGDAADLRQQITDYFGGGGENIELLCTENNADSGAQGKQSTSIVNALYLADSLSQLMKTEFNSFLWWDLRNGADTGGDFDPSLYGWRPNGDLGIMVGPNTRYPTYYGMKLMQYFVRPGDTVLNASSDNPLLSVYAAQRTDGTLTMLAINKDPTATNDAQINLANFTPWPTAAVRSFGIQQDEATRTNGPAAAQDIALTNYPSASANFTYSFPPYSLTLFTFASSDIVPAAPQLKLLSASPGQLVIQVRGQAYVPYVIQTSTDLKAWTSVETNLLIEGVLNVTHPISAGQASQFWRALWQP